eukprot:7057629-Prymnesium_polylepis.1
MDNVASWPCSCSCLMCTGTAHERDRGRVGKPSYASQPLRPALMLVPSVSRCLLRDSALLDTVDGKMQRVLWIEMQVGSRLH